MSMIKAIEQIVLVNYKGEPIGSAEKLASHNANTPLHLAFSCYVFNDRGEFLVTQRAHIKKVWPGVWTNSVCGHPAPGEDTLDAIKRRLDFELGMQAKNFELLVPDYIYKTPPFNGIIEHEYCPIYIAQASTDPKPNVEEVEDYKWVSWDDFIEQAQNDSDNVFSWWCKDQLRLLKNHPSITKLARS